MEHPYKTAGAVGAGVAIAAWIASRMARRDQVTPPSYRPAPVTPRPVATGPATPGTPVAPGTPAVPGRPATPSTPATPGGSTKPVTPATPRPADILTPAQRADLAERTSRAATILSDIRTTIAATEADIARLTADVAAELAIMARRGEDPTATALRVLRESTSRAASRWPRQDVVSKATDAVWESVFLAGPVGTSGYMELAEWTKTRQTQIITNDRIGTDELLLRAAVAAAIVSDEARTPLRAVVELWRRGVIPDVTGRGVVARRQGIVVAQSPAAPEKGLDAA